MQGIRLSSVVDSDWLADVQSVESMVSVDIPIDSFRVDSDLLLCIARKLVWCISYSSRFNKKK